MSQVGWYYARDNKQIGPISAAELKRLATVQELTPEDLVWREGMPEWSLARNVRGLFEAEAQTPEAVVETKAAPQAAPQAAPEATIAEVPEVARHPFDAVLDGLQSRCDTSWIDKASKFFWACGAYSLLAGIVTTVIFTVIVAVQTAQAKPLLYGVGSILLLAVLQFVAGKARDALERLHTTTEGTISSTALPRCVAALSLVAALALILFAVAGMLESAASVIRIPLSLASLVVGVYAAAVALNPTALNITINPTSKSSDETVGVLAFLVQVGLRSVPAVFGMGVLCGAILLAFACGQVFSGEQGLTLAMNTAQVARGYLTGFGFLPLAAYGVLLVGCLLIGLWRAVLGLADRTL